MSELVGANLGPFLFGVLAGSVASTVVVVYAAVSSVRRRRFSFTIWAEDEPSNLAHVSAHVSGHYGPIVVHDDARLTGEDLRAVLSAMGRMPVVAPPPPPREPRDDARTPPPSPRDDEGGGER